MRATRFTFVLTATFLGATVRAEAVTIRDIVELSRAGLAPEIIVALIEVDGSVFDLDAPQILDLQANGVSDPVVVAMIRTGLVRMEQPPEAGDVRIAARTSEQGDRRYRGRGDRPRRQPVQLVPVPVFVPMRHGHIRLTEGVPAVSPVDLLRFSSFGTGFHRDAPAITGAQKREPIYWGWGGTLRPGAWGQ